MKKEYIKPICEEQVLSVNTHVLAELSGIEGHNNPFGNAPKKRTNPF